ncbi:ORF6N domain-containing protein [Bradyrhizobium yuanmingense]|uniref:ORF6N domain-containing protein n=1 Tax=Bradyrhizobium yuanmingense TaxID=108015 RepID=UPI0004ACE9E7|nr:ORF6N domain-containing protein [Bradyrhizobium yuanmingense]
MRSQSAISSAGHGSRRTAPYAFTEQGVAMLSSVLSGLLAIAVNIEIMRTFRAGAGRHERRLGKGAR